MYVSKTRIQVGVDERQVMNQYRVSIPSSNSRSVPLVFIHGGAWRDPNNTCDDYDLLVDKIAKRANEQTDVNDEKVALLCYSLDYRLSPGVQHPLHLIDVLNCLKIIGESHTEVVLVGHSAGATLISQILTYEHILKGLNFTDVNNYNDLPKVSSIVMLDGIYDIKNMLVEYPSYEFFIKDAFKSKDIWETYGTFVNSGYEIVGEKELLSIYGQLPIVIVQSITDELLSFTQTQIFYKWLLDIGVDEKLVYLKHDYLGKHNDVYESDVVANLIWDKSMLSLSSFTETF